MSLFRSIALAFRDLRGGIRGFYTFIACIALGVAVITAVGGLSDAIDGGLERQGERILGGDMTFSRMHRPASQEERAWFTSKGRLSESATARAMARRTDGAAQALIEIKAVDDAYPLVGRITLASGEQSLANALDGGIAVDPIILERLSVKLGDSVTIGQLSLPVKATIGAEPDAVADRLTYGPRVLLSIETLKNTGLVQPGTLARWRYSLQLNDDLANTNNAFAKLKEQAKTALPQAGFTIVDRENPAPALTRMLERLRQFLTFLGLAALMVGGIGVASSVATFVDRRRNVIATFKSLGARQSQVFTILLVQICSFAAIGVALGLAVGAAVPAAVAVFYGDVLPVSLEATISWRSILTGAGYGFVVALLFALWPLGRAEQIRPSVLFRDAVAPGHALPRPAILAAIAVLTAVIVTFAVLASESRVLAIAFCASVVIVLGLFSALGEIVCQLARRLPRPRVASLRLAQTNIGAPGGLTRAVMLALGTGLSLLVAVALTDANLVKELQTRLPSTSPSYFALDIPKTEREAFHQKIQKRVPGTKLVEAPMLRGRLVSLKGIPSEEIKAPPEAQWVLRGDRGLTYADQLPKNSTLVKGAWWSPDYSGPPLVSFDAKLAEQLSLDVGDTVTVNVLGRNLTAKIENLREVKWQSLRLNFVMVFSPSALRAAPHTVLATLTLPPEVGLADQAELERELGKQFPTVTMVRVKDAIDAFTEIFSQIMMAVRVAGSVTLLSGMLVLAGALATAQRRRILDAVILKVLGATRGQILRAHLTEYMLLAVVAAGIATGLGSLAAWITVDQIMQMQFSFSWWPVGQALAISTLLVALFGTIGTLSVLRARPTALLRGE